MFYLNDFKGKKKNRIQPCCGPNPVSAMMNEQPYWIEVILKVRTKVFPATVSLENQNLKFLKQNLSIVTL